MSTDRHHSTSRPRVTIAIDDPTLRDQLGELLSASGISVDFEAPRQDLSELRQGDIDVVFVSRSDLPSEPDATVRELTPRDDHAAGVVVLSDGEGPKDRAHLVAAGAAKVLDSSLPDEDLKDALTAVTEAEAGGGGGTGSQEVRGYFSEPRLADFYSHSPRMREFLDVVQRLLDVDSPLMLSGETGVGKERLARAIHAEGPRAARPFVSVNVGAIPENLIEAELFGHEKGAFTGAAKVRKGPFEQAAGGTVFLDEIGDMPLHQQVKLLTVLQRHEVQRIGSDHVISVDARVMAATNRDLWEDVVDGRFREDLYYRLNVVPLEIPPLRERREDIPDLVGRFINHFREALGRTELVEVDEDAIRAMMKYEWPGNVRELANTIERAMLLTSGNVITLDVLPPHVRGGEPRDGRRRTGLLFDDSAELPPDWLARPLHDVRKDLLRRFERAYLRGLLKATHGKINETATRAGIKPRSLYDKMKQLGLRKEDFK